MKKFYVSNAEESIRMFKSDLMEGLSKVHFAVPLFIFVPAIFYFGYQSFVEGIGIVNFVLYFLIGLIVWTLTEYVMHRFIFHFQPSSEFGKKMHFIFHSNGFHVIRYLYTCFIRIYVKNQS